MCGKGLHPILRATCTGIGFGSGTETNDVIIHRQYSMDSWVYIMVTTHSAFPPPLQVPLSAAYSLGHAAIPVDRQFPPQSSASDTPALHPCESSPETEVTN